MKFAVKLVLVLFIAFIATPTVVSLIKEDVDTSIIYSMSEEEEQHNHSCKEINADLKIADSIIFSNFSLASSSLIISHHSLKHDTAASYIFSPPPDQV